MSMVETDVNDLELLDSGNISGRISIKVGVEDFPASDWYDFVVVILGWWLSEIERLFLGVSDSCVLSFMEGPYKVEVTRLSGSMCSLRCISKEKVVELEGIVPLHVLSKSIYDTAVLIVDGCVEKGWKNTDVLSLRDSVERSTIPPE